MELCKEYKPMCFNENTQRLSENFELDFQENLPQYLDDIERIIKCSVSNAVTNYDISDSKLNIHAKTIICLTYLNKDMCTLSNIFEEEFTKSIDIENSDLVSFADVKLITKYSNFRLINQRRIDIHTSLCAKICVYRKSSGKCLTNCKNAFTREINIPCLISRNAGVCTAEFDEAFSVSNSNTQIKNIVDSCNSCYLEETKIIKDKMLVKLRVEVSVIYKSDDNHDEKCSHSFSISKIIDISDCSDEDHALVNARISNIYIKSKTNSDNVVNEIEIVGCAAISYQIFSIEQQNFITDSYMPNFDTQILSERLAVKQSPIYYNDDRTDEIAFDCDKNIIEILNLSPSIESCSVVESELKLSVKLAFLYYDDTSQLCYYEKTSQLSFKISDEICDGEAVINLLSYDFVIKGTNRVTLRLSYNYQVYLYKTQNVDYLTDIEVSGEKNNLNMPELTLYFADKNEDIWDIAKSFSTDMSLIMEENNLKSQIIDNKMVLLVPGM